MPHICTHCGLSSYDGNLWCQRSECSAGNLTNTLRRGELLGEIEIGTMLRVMRTGTVYEATRGEELILLKVAHLDTQEDLDHDRGYARYLKNEAEILQRLAATGRSHAALPKLLPPYSQQRSLDELPYGRIVFRDKLRYFTVYEHIKGRFLRDILNDNPQPQPRYIGWLTLILCDLLVMLQKEVGIQHMALSPDIIMVREDLDGILRPILFDMGMYHQPRPQITQPTPLPEPVMSGTSGAAGTNPMVSIRNLYHEWLSRYVHPAYTAPELFKGRTPGPSVDVYGLSLMMYEMLTGRPAYTYETRTEQMVRSAVLDGDRRPLNRSDLSDKITQIVETGLSLQPERRFPHVMDFSMMLISVFGNVPPERVQNETWLQRNRKYLYMILLVVVVFLVGLAVAAELF
ncbi:MAG: hypothetical protein CUN56_02075 [Phototrophicales bacterium]|nr:MAG: hypothetical protein CUN56_02075 [Phototrophicales bacterium]RMG70062.1 MAG: hypothetical protein D6711_18320 [Chloroflexota bacterium]